MNLSISKAFPAAIEYTDGTWHYAERLTAIRQGTSGVYGIWDATTRDCLYIGESHTDRLYDTITRHFRAWRINPRRDAQGRRFGGKTYNRFRVLVHFVETEPKDAAVVQYEQIARLEPRDNVNVGSTVIEIPT